MLKTRAGASVKLIDLLDEGVARARAIVEERNPTLPEEVKDRLGREISIGAVKYADLSSDRIKDYTFAWNRMLAFDGNTAPYLQYAPTPGSVRSSAAPASGHTPSRCKS